MNLDTVLATQPNISFEVILETRKRCHPPPLILAGIRRCSLLKCIPPERGTFILFVPLLSEPSWPFVFIRWLITHTCHPFQWFCWLPLLGAPREEKQLNLDYGVSFCGSLLIWLRA